MGNSTARRGRPPKAAGQTKTEYLDIRVEATEKLAFREAAELAGLDLSAWIRERLRANARKELQAANLPVPFMATEVSGKPNVIGRRSRKKPARVQSPSEKEQVKEVHFQPPSAIHLVFADGFSGEWKLSELGLDLTNMKLSTIRPTVEKAAIRIQSKWGDDVRIDGSVIRAVVDPVYAKECEDRFSCT